MSDDLISRAAAIDEIKKHYRAHDNDLLELIAFNIGRLPSAQPQIIRCKDCKHRHLDGMIWNCSFWFYGGEDFFCAYGAKDGDSDDE